jgi:hypothetical protein
MLLRVESRLPQVRGCTRMKNADWLDVVASPM